MSLFVDRFLTLNNILEDGDCNYPSWKEERRRFMESLVLTQDCFHTGSEATQNDFKDTTVSEMEQFPSLLPLVNPPPLVYCDYCCQPILVVVILVVQF